ncbi:guanylate kinase [Kiritimatiellaeota bacterium B1221]|nr:guanylate kinase [Kiritimatiellaeota bacterium B1221]
MNILSTPHPVIFLISAPSGAGKTTLCHRLLGECPKLKYSVSSTTRLPREGEIDGVDYDFLSRADFDQRVADGSFLEYAEVHGNGYGTCLETLEKLFKAGYSVLMDVDVQGAAHIRRNLQKESIDPAMRNSFVDVFISPPSLQSLRERLEGRGKDAADVIEERLKNASVEMSQAGLYEFQIVNDNLDTAYDELLAVYKASTLKTICVD